MNNYNILWLFTDSVRRYHSTDDRSRLKIMDEFGKESVECLNVVTSSPSTFQAICAMVSGMHSYYISRNYDDFIFDNEHLPSLTKVLQRENYHCYNFLMHRESRVILSNVLPAIDRKFWPKGFTHQQWWDNSKINEAVDKTLTMEVKRPSFFFVNYNCRQDPMTSDLVKYALDKFRQHGYTEENTITILCSDHGYPDLSKDFGPEFNRKHNLSHDLILTDDNIMIPFLIQYPNCPKGSQIETTVASIDIYPTIMDILGINIPSGIHGKSLMPLINKVAGHEKMMESRFHRCDSRLSFQTGRGTAIRNGKYKYVFYHDNVRNKNEEFFDIENDTLENNDLINSAEESIKTQIDIFREQFRRSEKDAMDFQLSYLFNKFTAKHNEDIINAREILITDSCSTRFTNMLIKMIKKINSNTNINILMVEHDPEEIKDSTAVIDSGSDDWGKLKSETVRNITQNIEIDILFAPYNTSEERDNSNFTAIVGQIKAKKKVYLDYNMESFKKTTSYFWKLFKAAWPFIKYEPSFFVTCLTRFIKYKLFRRGIDWTQVFKNQT